MRARAGLYLALLLLIGSLACSSKPAADANNANDTSATSADSNSNSNSSPAAGSSSRREAKRPAAPKERTVVPAGTVVTVRLGEALGSKLSTVGQSFTARVASPVEVGGKTVIPADSEAKGTVVDAKPLGKIKGEAVLEIRLDSVTVHGTEHAVQTASVTTIAKGKGKRTAVLAGGGAAVGALIGGLAGGGKGAAIGALAGGGGGTAGAVLTGNKDVVLPAESAVSFKLDAPLEVH